MIKPKDLQTHINALSQMADLTTQLQRQVEFWRSQARAQMKKLNERTVVVSKNDLTYSDLCESFYYEDKEGECWWIYDQNMYSFNLKETLFLIKINREPDGDNIGVLV